MGNWEWNENEKTNGEFLLEIINRHVNIPDFPLRDIDGKRFYFLYIEEEWFNAPCNTITTKDGRLCFSYEPMKGSDEE